MAVKSILRLPKLSRAEGGIESSIACGSTHLQVPLPLQIRRLGNSKIRDGGSPRRSFWHGGSRLGNQRRKAAHAGEDQVDRGGEPGGECRVADVCSLQERRQLLVGLL